MLPDLFAIVFDGWSVGATHYLAIFASFTADYDNGFTQRLLSFSPFGEEEEDGFTAKDHK